MALPSQGSFGGDGAGGGVGGAGDAGFGGGARDARGPRGARGARLGVERPRWLGVAAVEACSSAATADGLEVELSAVTLARFFAAALRCDARAAAPASLAAAFTKRRRRRSKNVAVTA